VQAQIARFLLRAIGWRCEGAAPEARKFVLIAAPHTSNWDLPLMLLMAKIHGIQVSWMGKHTLFRGPAGVLFRALGGIPVDRRSPQGLVGQMAEEIGHRDAIALAVPPEGTRSRSETWKSGFYQIARAAGVPIVLGYLDYGSKCGGFGPTLMPSDDTRADMDLIRSFYADKVGLYPDKFGPVKLREEPAG
jgi:1-acyl-sn-glycerol-3-phosphate acyltransferase